MADEQAVNRPGRDILSRTEIAAFCAQIAMIMKSGISAGEGLSIMAEDMKNHEGRKLLEGIHEKLETGSQLHMALEESGKFPKYVVDMTEIGERTGKLDNVMDSLCLYYEREEAVSKNIRNAVTYPLIMIVMMVLVVIVLMVQVLPIFNQVFTQLGAEMTGISNSMMNLGQAMGRYSYAIIGIIAAILAAYFVMRATSGGRALLDNWKATFPLTRNLQSKIASEHFASGMSLMLSSGLDVDQSLDMVYKLVDNPIVKTKIMDCKKYIDEGATFSDAIVKADIFSGVYGRMVSVGFKTGSVDTVMEKLADLYGEEIDSQISNTISVLEPSLVAVLSVIVGMILLSVMLPLMGIMSSIG